MRKGHIFALCATGLAVTVAAVCTMVAIRASNMRPGHFDQRVFAQIRRLCGTRTDCVVHMGDLVDGDWDRLYRFDSEVPIPEIERELGIPNLRRSELQSTTVLMKAGKVVFLENSDEGFEAPIAGDIYFNTPSGHQRHILITPASTMKIDRDQVNSGQNEPLQPGGDYYVLTSQ